MYSLNRKDFEYHFGAKEEGKRKDDRSCKVVVFSSYAKTINKPNELDLKSFIYLLNDCTITNSLKRVLSTVEFHEKPSSSLFSKRRPRCWPSDRCEWTDGSRLV